MCWVMGMGHSWPQGLSGDKVDPQRNWAFLRGDGLEVGRGPLCYWPSVASHVKGRDTVNHLSVLETVKRIWVEA